jgi:hypothetical protein
MDAVSGELPRYAWLLDPPEPETQAQAGYVGSGVLTAPSLIAAEQPLWLRLMKRFWVSGDSGVSTYGAARLAPSGVSKWGVFRQHQGRLSTSASSWQLQLADVEVGYRIPPVDADGRIALDATDAELVSHSCRTPAGIDVIVTVNQANDRVCVDEEKGAAPAFTCEGAYGSRFRDYILHGLCGVDWEAVRPVPLS